MFSVYDYISSLRKRFKADLTLPIDMIPSYVTENVTRLRGIKVVLWDVYGTLLRIESGVMDPPSVKKIQELAAFIATSEEFGFNDVLKKTKYPAKWLRKQYHQLIDKDLRAKQKQGIKLPAFRIEDIWGQIVTVLVKRGYKPDLKQCRTLDNFVLSVCCYFDMHLSKCCLYNDISDVISTLHKNGIRQGLLANTQFYTQHHLQLACEEKLGKRRFQFDRYFEPDLRFLSHDIGLLKPGKIFETVTDALKQQGIQPNECLYIGNDMYTDVWGAWRLGFKTVYAAHDQHASKSRIDKPQCNKLVPDATIKKIKDILSVIALPNEEQPLPPFNVGFLYYHLYPCGVKTVMQNNALALASEEGFENIFINIFASIGKSLLETGIFSLRSYLTKPVNNLHIRNIDIEALNQTDTRFRNKQELISAAREIKRTITRNLDLSRVTWENPYILHAHNFSLAKNPCAPIALSLIARWALQHKRPLLILNQVHDFVENNRYDSLKNVLNCTGTYDPEFAASFLYPDLPNMFYAVLTRDDLDNLNAVGIDPKHILLLPNSVQDTNISQNKTAYICSEDGYCIQLRSILAKIAREAGFNFSEYRKTILQPVKSEPRKNIAESILLTAALNKLDDTYQLLVTLKPTTPEGNSYSKTITRFVQQHKLPVYIGVDHRSILTAMERKYRPKESALLSAESVFSLADTVLSTSLIEGFGLPFIEAWLYGKPVYGRRLDNVISDFEHNNVSFDHLYNSIIIKLDWIDISLEQLIRQYHRKINMNRALISLPPLDRCRVRSDILNKKIFSIHEDSCIDFADLGMKTQLQFIEKALNDEKLMKGFIEFNPFVCDMAEHIQAPPTELITKNQTTIRRRYGIKAHSRRLLKTFETMRTCYQDELQEAPHKHWINNRYLIEKYLSVENTRLLL